MPITEMKRKNEAALTADIENTLRARGERDRKFLASCAAFGMAMIISACSATAPSEIMVADTAPDPYASDAIKSADWNSAEAILSADLKSDPLKMINMAYVYRQLGRDGAAISLYEEILALDENPYGSRSENSPLRVKTIARIALNDINGVPNK